MKQWCIVQFSNGDTELVPHTWVHGKKVFWPPHPIKEIGKVRTAIRRRDKPCDGWRTYEPIRILISRDTYEEAEECLERYLNQLCDTSDMESDTENQMKRRFKRPNQVYAHDEFDQDNSQYEPPSKRSPAPESLFPATTSTAGAFHEGLPRPNTSHADACSPTGPSPFQGLSPEDTAWQALKDVTLQKLLSMVTELSSEVRDLRKEVQEFRQSCRCCQPVGALGHQMHLTDPVEMPIRNMEGLDRAEAILQTPEAYKAMVARLTVVGGKSLESRVRKILSFVLTNEVASGLNWAGKKLKQEQKRKRAFKGTRLCKCISDALTQQLGSGMNDDAFAQAAQKWLRYAPDRAGGVGRG